MLSAVLVSLSVCLPICLSVSNITNKLQFICFKRIVTKFYGGVQGGNRNKRLYIDGDPDHHADCPIGNLAITQQIMSRF